MHIVTHSKIRENMVRRRVETESRLQRESLAPGLLSLGYLFLSPRSSAPGSGRVEEEGRKGVFPDKKVLYLL